MFTPDGLQRIWEILLGNIDDNLSRARLLVTDGANQRASAQMDEGFPRLVGLVTDDQGRQAIRLELQATFGESEANFDWAVRQVVTARGVVVDSTPEDHGRKVSGAVWTLNASLDLLLVD